MKRDENLLLISAMAANHHEVAVALDVAVRYHGKQRDQQGAPYMWHLATVAERMTNPTMMAAALLHDVLEDTDLDMDGLRAEFASAGVRAEDRLFQLVDALTRRPGETHRDYIVRVIQSGPDACEIKRADIFDNMDAARGEVPGDLITRYLQSLDMMEIAERRGWALPVS